MSLTDAQRALRRTGIGGSEIAAVLGVATRKTEDGSPKTAFDTWFAKVHPMEQLNTVDAERGIYLEPGIGDWYLSRTGRARGMAPGTVRHATESVALCTPDLLALDEKGRARLVSIKAPRHSFEWGPDGSSDVPIDYVLQLQWEHLVCSSFMPAGALDDGLDLAAFVGGELRTYHFRADLEMQAWMLEGAKAWWAAYCGPIPTPPPLDDSAGARVWLKQRFPASKGEVRPASPHEEVLLLALREAEAAQKATEGVYDTARRRVEEAIGNDAGLESSIGVVTWKSDAKNARRFLRHWKRNERREA